MYQNLLGTCMLTLEKLRDNTERLNVKDNILVNALIPTLSLKCICLTTIMCSRR